MGIYLSRADIAVSQHCLNAADIGTVNQQISCETMSHCMRTDVFRYPGQSRIFINNSLDTSGTQTAVITTCSSFIISAVADKQGGQRVAALF